jgi:hypothetical protein
MSQTLLSKKLSGPQLKEVERLLMADIDHQHIAELIQSEWGLVGDVSQAVVLQMIRAHYKALVKMPKGETPAPAPPAEDAFNPLEAILTLARQQKGRVELALQKEKEIGMPMEPTGRAMKEYQETLALMQRMQIEHDIAQGKKPPVVGGKVLTTEQRIAEAIQASERFMNRHHG